MGIYSNGTPEVDSDQTDVARFPGGTRGEMPYGGDTKHVDNILSYYPILFGLYYADEGVTVIYDTGSTDEDGDNVVYLLSPSSNAWLYATK